MSFVVTVEALLAQAKQAGDVREQWANAHIDKLLRTLWQRRQRVDVPLDLALVREIVGVEFALWALPVAETTVAGQDADQVGRMIACVLARVALDHWLPEAGALVGFQIGPGYADDLFRDLESRKRPIGDWRDWLVAVQSLIETTEDRGYQSAVRLAALSCAKSMVVPSDGRRLPGKKALEGRGRHCAFAAYFDACWAWATGNDGYRAAHRIADLARIYNAPDEEISEHLDTLHTELLKSADAVVAPWANAAFDRCIGGGEK